QTSFGAATSVPPNPYPLGSELNVAVDNSGGASAGDVYVSDRGNARVEKFSPAGELLLMFGKDVNKTKTEAAGFTTAERDVCVIASGDVCQAGTESSAADAFRGVRWVAVDPSNGPSSGDVYVGTTDFFVSYVYKFTPSGQRVTSWAE